MAPSTLDLLVLTFNCAKNLVNVPVFANHLQAAFGQNATGLPDVVVFSLQEIAPLSYAFIGDYFLGQYVARFDDAINLAASMRLHDGDGEDVVSVTPTSTPTPTADNGPRHYTLVRARNVGYTAILLFARDPTRLRDLQEAEVGFGAAEMGNKGAVGLRTLYDAGGERSTELTFVATHLAAMEWNLPRRNANWAAIMRGLTFENPEAVLSKMRKDAAAAAATVPLSEGDGDDDNDEGEEEGEDEGSEQARLLQDTHRQQQDLRLQQQFHDLSVFKPSSHLFVAGDLNYRISTTSPTPYAAFPSMDPDSENYYPSFFPLDQLTRERIAGRTLHGLTEHQVRFPPTYKYDVEPRTLSGAGDDGRDAVPWKFAPHRYPSWTDRILFLELPPWMESRMNVRAYDAMPVVRSSDHRAVFLRVDVPLVAPADLAPRGDAQQPGTSSPAGGVVDPRVRLPVEIDPEAWERRAAARRRELMAGWSMFLWSTKQGACILAALLVAGASGYWLYQAA